MEELIETQTVQSQSRATRKAMISCLAAAAEAAAPIDDTAWFSHAIIQLRAIVSTFHFYGSLSLTADLCLGKCRSLCLLWVTWLVTSTDVILFGQLDILGDHVSERALSGT